MKQKTICILKIVLGAYLAFVGSMHFINMYAQKPSDLYIQIVIAFFFVVAGVMYMGLDIRKLIVETQKEKTERVAQQEAEERKRRYQELHNRDKFRTAPMRVVTEALEKIETEEAIEEEEE